MNHDEGGVFFLPVVYILVTTVYHQGQGLRLTPSYKQNERGSPLEKKNKKKKMIAYLVYHAMGMF